MGCRNSACGGAEAERPPGPGGGTPMAISPAYCCCFSVTASAARDSEPLVPPTVCAGPRARTRSHLSPDGVRRVRAGGPQPLIPSEIKNVQVTALRIVRYAPADGTYRLRCVSTEGAHRPFKVNWRRHVPYCRVNWRRHLGPLCPGRGPWRGQGGDLSPLGGHNLRGMSCRSDMSVKQR